MILLLGSFHSAELEEVHVKVMNLFWLITFWHYALDNFLMFNSSPKLNLYFFLKTVIVKLFWLSVAAWQITPKFCYFSRNNTLSGLSRAALLRTWWHWGYSYSLCSAGSSAWLRTSSTASHLAGSLSAWLLMVQWSSPSVFIPWQLASRMELYRPPAYTLLPSLCCVRLANVL